MAEEQATPSPSADVTDAAPAPPPADRNQEAAKSERPEYLPEKFWDPEGAAPRVESLAKSYGDLERLARKNFETLNDDERAQLHNTLGFDPAALIESDLRQKWEDDRMADRPAASTDYTFDAADAGLPEGMDFDPQADDPMLNWWREFSHKNGFTNDVFGEGISTWLGALAGMAPDIEAERGKLGTNADARLDGVVTYLKGAGLNEAEYAAIEGAVRSADGVAALEKLAALGGPPNSQSRETVSTAGKITEEELRALQRTPEYQRNDPAMLRKVSEGYASLYPDGI
ncbi:MAG: hypothetical protein O3A51_03215 [Verrucomicrobia bacterium]|nr:hypothetical protein [Verrucomicrobiota bacterium]